MTQVATGNGKEQAATVFGHVASNIVSRFCLDEEVERSGIATFKDTDEQVFAVVLA
jgi:hypothetical protein